MSIELSLRNSAARLTLLVLTLVSCAGLGLLALTNFVVDAFADEHSVVATEALSIVSSRFPSSARLHARLAQAEVEEDDRDLGLAEFHASQAAALSPWDHNNRTLLAYIKEAEGDRAAAETSLRSALALAPNDKEVHWGLANLLLRESKLDESVEQFQTAISADPSHLPSSLDLLWSASQGNVEVLDAVAGNGMMARLTLAQFLLNKSRVLDAAAVFSRIDPRARYDTPEGSQFLDSLIQGGNLDLARSLWADLVGRGNQDRPLVWNGGFESEISAGFTQFDWKIVSSNYARISVDTGSAHSGNRCLRIDFTGLDTTRLDDEIKQLVVVSPGARYRLICYVKSDALVTPEGPRVVLADQKSQVSIGSSEAIASGSNDWKPLAIDFVGPQSRAVIVSVKRTPKFSYDKPTSGTIWMDDFAITRIGE